MIVLFVSICFIVLLRTSVSIECYSCSGLFLNTSDCNDTCKIDYMCFTRKMFDFNDCSETITLGCLDDTLISGACNISSGHVDGGIATEILCCSTDYCNIDLTFNMTICTTSDTSPTPSQIPVLPIALMIPLTINICFCFLIITVLVQVYMKKRKRSRPQVLSQPVATTDNHHAKQNGHEMGLPSYSITNSMEHVTMSEEESSITCTSGSGAGMPFLVKRTIAHSITLGESIGGGRFGQVYLGYYQGEQFAVKKFFSKDEQSWFHESDIYNTFNLRHENILSCFATDMFSNNGVTELWLITQYYPRGSLYEELNRDPLSVEKTMGIIYSICRGISYLHMELTGTQGKPSIAHRDIKSNNILVKNDLTCCIADFGLAIVKDPSHPTLYKPEDIKQGTKRYMSPEILSETINSYNFESFLRSDMYSFGLVLWEICRRCDKGNGEAEEYSVPFQSLVPPDPSFEDMREIIVDKGMTLEIPNRWTCIELLKGLSVLMSECWYRDPAARPTSAYVRKKLLRLAENCHLKIAFDY